MDLAPKLRSNKCKGCTDRHVGCHADCELYSAYRRELDAANEKIRKDAYNRALGFGPGYSKLVEDIKAGKYAKK